MTTVTVHGVCFSCGCGVQGCPDCQLSVKIDPVSGLPPDVRLDDTGKAVPKPVDPAALERATQALVCDTCIERVNARHPAANQIQTSQARHAVHLRRLQYVSS